MAMYKEEAIQLYEGSCTKLAAALGISKSAVSQWPDDKPVPEKQELRIKYELHPDLYRCDS